MENEKLNGGGKQDIVVPSSAPSPAKILRPTGLTIPIKRPSSQPSIAIPPIALTRTPTSAISHSPPSPHSSELLPPTPSFFAKSTSRAKRLSSLVLSSAVPSIPPTRSPSNLSTSIISAPIMVPPINASADLAHPPPPSSTSSHQPQSQIHESSKLLPLDFDEGVLRTLCTLECGLPLILDRLKQAVGTAREVSTFLKKKSQLDEEYGQKLSRLAKSSTEAYTHAGGELKAGSFASQFRAFLAAHEKMGLERLEAGQKLNCISDELLNVSKEVERVRKANKDVGWRLEKSVSEAELAAEKAKMRFEGAAEDLERMLLVKSGEQVPNQSSANGAGQFGKAISKLTAKSNKSAGQLAKMEDEIRAKMSSVSDVYRAQVLATQQVRQEYFNLQLPRILRTLKEHSDEIDLGIQYYLTNYVSQTESIILSDALTVSTLPLSSSTTNMDDDVSLSSLVRAIDNRTDFKDYMAHYAAHFNQTHLAPSITPLSSGQPLTLPPQSQQQNPLPSIGIMPQGSSPRDSFDRESKAIFGVELATQIAREGSIRGVPRILERAVEAIERAGGLDVVGIYRLSGTTSKIARLKARLDVDVENVKLDFGDDNLSELNDLTGALKLWLRELPEPLFTWNLYSGFIEAGRIENDRLRHIRLHERVNELPDANYASLKFLMGHLHKVRMNEARNSMGSSNLAVIFGPTLLKPPGPGETNDSGLVGNGGDALAEMSAQCRAVETILEHYREIFVEDGEEETDLLQEQPQQEQQGNLHQHEYQHQGRRQQQLGLNEKDEILQH